MTPFEKRIWRLSTSIPNSSDESKALVGLFPRIKDPVGFIDLAFQEGVANLYYKNLKSLDLLDTLSTPQHRKLKTNYYHTASSNLKRIHDLKSILHHSDRIGIPVVLLQGIVLLQTVYDDIGLRPMSDIDLWILERHYPAFKKQLIARKYRQDPLYPGTFRRGETTFDIHTHVLWADRIRTRKFLMTRGQEAIYETTEPLRFEGEKALVLNRYDQVLYLSLHALKHNVSRILWLVDIKNMVAGWQRVHWRNLWKRAVYLGQEKSICRVLFLIRQIFDVTPPQELSGSFKSCRQNALESKLLRKRSPGHFMPAWAPFVLFSPNIGSWKFIPYTLENLFPRPEIMRQIFPERADQKAWRLYAMRLIQIFRGILGSITGIGRFTNGNE